MGEIEGMLPLAPEMRRIVVEYTVFALDHTYRRLADCEQVVHYTVLLLPDFLGRACKNLYNMNSCYVLGPPRRRPVTSSYTQLLTLAGTALM